ncbi:MAG: GNAT family N-acetyltransferase [Bacilli bacterium]|nr:GNAT family N-acetyltransferase [Bacilli bacterium]
MELEYRVLDEHSPGLDEVCFLFETAFPPEERPPFDLAISWKNSSFNGIYHDGEFVALADLVEYQDYLYVFFLAVKEEKRNQGIGAQILSDLKKKYADKTLFLLADEVGEEYEDNPLRLRRVYFYERNGFHHNGIHIKEFEVMYQMQVCGTKEVDKRVFLSTMERLIGPEMMKKLYSDV